MSIAETPINVLPTHLDLPHTDDKPVENAYQPFQSMLLTGSLSPVLDRLHPDGNYFIGADTGIYWRLTRNVLEGCRSPDWYYIPNVPRLLNGTYRRSYVMWQESGRPVLIIEYVSGDGSEERDTTPEKGKFWVYENGIQSSYYAIHDPDKEELSVYQLIHGRYETLSPTQHGRFRIVPMGIDLGIWQGEYQGCPAAWLRAWDWNGALIPTPEELAENERIRAEQERNRAEQERNRAEQERNRAEKLSERLRQLGIDSEAI
jgi:Uma2 family endonuclease